MRYLQLTTSILALLALAACGNPAAPALPEAGHEAEHEAGHESEETPRVALTAEQLRTAAIDVVPAGPEVIRETLAVYGVVAPDAERVRDVGARFPGVIRSVNATVGDTVRAGATLATVESNESLQTYAVVAPLAGVVTARQANPGEQTGDKSLFTVADLSKVWVELALFPRDSAKVRVGQAVRVTSTDAGPGGDGRIVYVAPFGSSQNQTLTARVRLDNAERRWAPGLYVNAAVVLGEATASLTVRNEALQTLEGRTVVFVQGDEGFEPRPVRLGRSDGQHSEVLEGIAAGERYAAANSFILKAELGKGEASHEH
jgi:cobalt-zinc-cadmium efflux system membrane fusion protein